MHETHFALATKRSWVVQALAVFTQCGIIGTFVYIDAVIAISLEACITLTPKRAVIVYTLSVLIASSIVGQAFVYVTATDTVSGKSILTSTLVRSL